MVLVQDLACLRDVQAVFGRDLPRQLQHEFQVGADDVVIRGAGRQPLQPGQLAPGFFQNFFRQVRLFQAFPEQVAFGLFRILLAQLLLDGPQLLAQEVLALFLAHLGLGRVRDLAAKLQHLKLVRQKGVGQPQGVGAVLRFQQRLLLADVQAEHGGQQVRQAQRVVGSHQQPAQFLRRLRLRQRNGLGGQLHHFVVQRLDLGSLIVGQRQRLHRYLQVGLRLLQPQDVDALDAEHDQLHGALVGPRHPLDHRPGADLIQIVQAGLLDRGVALSGDHDLPLFGRQRGFDGRQRGGPAHRQRHQQMRKQNAVLQRKQR